MSVADAETRVKVLAIKGSPRRHGMTSQLADAVLEGAASTGGECREIFLRDLSLKDCRGCRGCQKTTACVVRNDDIGKLEEAVSWADAIVFATPTHWGNLSGYMLRAIERLFGYLIVERRSGFPIPQHASGKKAVIVTACSTAWPWNWVFNQSRAVKGRFAEICRYSKMPIVRTLVLPGTFDLDTVPDKYLKKARQAGARLV